MPFERLIAPAASEHYVWGPSDNPCEGWHLVRTLELSVILERMPPGTHEVRHCHERARQFFFVLEGEAVIERDGREFTLASGDGLEIPPGTPHQMFNRSPHDLRFLVISQPPSQGDRRVLGATAE